MAWEDVFAAIGGGLGGFTDAYRFLALQRAEEEDRKQRQAEQAADERWRGEQMRRSQQADDRARADRYLDVFGPDQAMPQEAAQTVRRAGLGGMLEERVPTLPSTQFMPTGIDPQMFATVDPAQSSGGRSVPKPLADLLARVSVSGEPGGTYRRRTAAEETSAAETRRSAAQRRADDAMISTLPEGVRGKVNVLDVLGRRGVRGLDLADLATPEEQQAAAAAELADTLELEDAKARIRAKYRPAPASGSQTENLVTVISPEGTIQMVPKGAEANTLFSAGWRPYERGTVSQGRPITSGDAGRLSDITESVNLLDELETELGTTGAASKVGAMLPNVVTELIGWGSDAKQRQGTIDKVKQIIGKALEGGVLRKEDEYKYTKILPTISDPPEVAASKLAGLRETLQQKHGTFLDSLDDAGYDTAAYRTRGTPGMKRGAIGKGVISRAALRQRAKQLGMTEQEAEADAKSRGYTIR